MNVFNPKSLLDEELEIMIDTKFLYFGTSMLTTLMNLFCNIISLLQTNEVEAHRIVYSVTER